MKEKSDRDNSSRAETAAKEIVTPFENAALIKYWDKYAEAMVGNAYLKSTMTNCKPVLLENFYFEVSVHNPGQQDELLSDSVKLLPYLRKQLKNTRIQMRIRISETNEKKLAYTASEKYEHLFNINPLLGRLKDEFGLMPD
jgi:DNA polymerase-3 subunit gamma/tau